MATPGEEKVEVSPRPKPGLGLRWPSLPSLRAQLIVPYALLTLLTAMVGIFVVTRLVTSSIRERFVNQLRETSSVAADGVVRREQEHLKNLRLMAFTTGVAEGLVNRDTATLQSLLCPLILNNRVEVLATVGAEGREIITLAGDPATTRCVVVSQAEIDLSEFELVAKVLRGQIDDAGDKFAAVQELGGVRYLLTSAPVHDSGGQLAGVLVIGTRLESLLADLKSQAVADHIAILDPTGRLMATTLQLDEGPEAVELEPQAALNLGPSLTRELHLAGRPYEAMYSPLNVRRQVVGVLGVILSSNYVVSTEATNRNLFSLIFTLATMAVIILGYVLSQSIARPILRLRAISQAVAAGDLEQHTGLQRPDEIGELATAFDLMTLRLRERTAEAARLYAETVQRNIELAEINAQLQATQQQLIQSEKLAAIGQLTAGIVHDVKNPLAIIKGLAEVLLEEDDVDPAVRKQLGVMRDSAGRANRIVTDLLKFARQSTLEMKEQDLRGTIEAVVRLTSYLAREAHVQVITDLPDQPVNVSYDGPQIEQVLVNLVQNAIQAMPDRGALRISLSEADQAVAIAVQDTGTGIPAENLTRVFDPFFTTKPEGEGTGLGLSVSYGIVSHHGGRIDVESAVGEGTTFTILLPKSRPVAVPPGD
jgi:signal transduction histidine kinase